MVTSPEILPRALLTLAICLAPGCGDDLPAAPAPVYPEHFDVGLLIVVGDQQRTARSERALGREHNDAERSRVAREIAAAAPALLVVVGDLVFTGASAKDWALYDTFMEPVRKAGVAVLPALGNHDYDGDDDEALAHLAARFPQIGRSRWYRRRFGNLGLVWLDSNRKVFSRGEWREQAEWFRDAVAALERDDDVRAVLVFLHHAPFTNSARSEDSVPVAEAFLPTFLSARKTVALVAGHAHAYEHFVKDGKHFVVSGGGGAPRVKLLEGDQRRHEDLFVGGSPRPFHFLRVTADKAAVTFVVRGFDEGDEETREIDRFTVALPQR